MAIISSRIARNHDRGNGSLSIHEEHTDNFGVIHERRYYCPINYNFAAALTGHIPQLEASIIQAEKDNIREQVENNVNPSTIPLLQITENDRIEYTVKGVMSSRAGDVIEGSKFLKGVSDLTLDSIFDTSKRDRINARVNNIVVNEVAIIADQNQREEL
ncbi:MAG: hypothetical protein ACUZ8H_14775 [Candidatus Anammoxibacter sp.]